jgi:HSP20 family protein
MEPQVLSMGKEAQNSSIGLLGSWSIAMAPAKEAPKRKRTRRSGWWFDIFDEMNRMDRMMEEMMEKAFTMPKAGAGPQPFVYGFSMSVGPEGKPVIREFGNVEPSSQGPMLKEEREPLVDVMQEGNDVVVVTELPGVEKDQINLESTDRTLKIAVNSPKRRYLKEMEMPHLVDPRTAKATYKNGVLEVRFHKTEEKKPTRPIRVD